MKRLYFIRHGESVFNKTGKWTGSTDAPLTEEGHLQAEEAAKKMHKMGLKFDLIISSPLSRALETAQHVAKELGYPIEQIQTYAPLVERNFGILEGNRDQTASESYKKDESAIDHYTDVEKMVELQARAASVLAYLEGLPFDNILIVGHGAIGRALRRQITGDPITVRGKNFANAEFERFL